MDERTQEVPELDRQTRRTWGAHGLGSCRPWSCLLWWRFFPLPCSHREDEKDRPATYVWLWEVFTSAWEGESTVAWTDLYSIECKKWNLLFFTLSLPELHATGPLNRRYSPGWFGLGRGHQLELAVATDISQFKWHRSSLVSGFLGVRRWSCFFHTGRDVVANVAPRSSLSSNVVVDAISSLSTLELLFLPFRLWSCVSPVTKNSLFCHSAICQSQSWQFPCMCQWFWGNPPNIVLVKELVLISVDQSKHWNVIQIIEWHILCSRLEPWRTVTQEGDGAVVCDVRGVHGLFSKSYVLLTAFIWYGEGYLSKRTLIPIKQKIDSYQKNINSYQK